MARYQKLKLKLNENPENKIWVDVASPEKPTQVYNFIDLFSGAGGFTQGLVQAEFNAITSVEINEIASATHQRNFPSCHHYCGDIHELNPDRRGFGATPIHIVIGSPPCQGFSVAGKRDPHDPRNILFKQFVRVVKELQPLYFVMENVPGILTMQKGVFVESIFEAFAEIGYPGASVSILESADYGVAQYRPRAIFIGNRMGLPNPYPAPMFTPENHKSIESAIVDLPVAPDAETHHLWSRHSEEFIARIAEVKAGESLYPTFRDAYKRQYTGRPSMTVKENHGGTHIHPHLNRCISAREMARLQSFPDTFLFEGTMKQAMWQIGNAVPPLLAQSIGLALIPTLNQITGENNA